ncbi:MAG: chorismate-binding protein, partial [Rhodospirillaceae bacterium]
DGDGDAAVVLRSAYLEDRTAVLWAGAGIMADSDPHAEFAETELKLASLMEVINAPMTGAAALASRLDSSGLVKQRNASGTLERPVQQTLG